MAKTTEQKAADKKKRDEEKAAKLAAAAKTEPAAPAADKADSADLTPAQANADAKLDEDAATAQAFIALQEQIDGLKTANSELQAENEKLKAAKGSKAGPKPVKNFEKALETIGGKHDRAGLKYAQMFYDHGFEDGAR